MNKKVFMIIAIILMIAIVGIGGYSLIKNNTKNEKNCFAKMR